MAITIKDVVEYLEKYPEQTPVYWGIDGLPCWVTCAEADMEEFKKVMFEEKNPGGIEYIYIEYCGFVRDHARKDLNYSVHWKDRYETLRQDVKGSFWNRLLYVLFGSD